MSRPHTKSHPRSFEHMRLAAKLVPFCCPFSQSQISAQIVAPQRATNQTSEIRKSTSSRFMILTDDVGLAANSAGPMHYLNSRIQSCYCAPMIWGLPPPGLQKMARARGCASIRMPDRPQKITFADMRDMGVRGL